MIRDDEVRHDYASVTFYTATSASPARRLLIYQHLLAGRRRIMWLGCATAADEPGPMEIEPHESTGRTVFTLPFKYYRPPGTRCMRHRFLDALYYEEIAWSVEQPTDGYTRYYMNDFSSAEEMIWIAYDIMLHCRRFVTSVCVTTYFVCERPSFTFRNFTHNGGPAFFFEAKRGVDDRDDGL